MKTRILLGSIMIAILTAILYADWYWQTTYGWNALVLTLASLALFEFYSITQLPKNSKTLATSLGILLLLNTCIQIHLLPQIPLTEITLALALALTFFAHFPQQPTPQTFSYITTSLLGILYIPLLSSYFLRLRAISPHGEWLLLFTITVSKSTDIFAYFSGKFLGKHLWIPHISPSKTWEGLLGGITGATILATILTKLSPLSHLTWYILPLSALLALLAQLGDLCESYIKRSFGKKDSGQWLPEFGGVLDLLDSLLLTGPTVYYAYLLLANHQT